MVDFMERLGAYCGCHFFAMGEMFTLYSIAVYVDKLFYL